MMHAYPSMERIGEIRDAHDGRVLCSALGPAGDVVCTAAGDELIKFWRLWDAGEGRKKEGKERGGATREGILSIR